MGTSSARPDDLDAFVRGSRAADDELRTHDGRLRAVYDEFQSGTRWGRFDATSLITGFGRYIELNEADAKWVAGIAAAFRAAGGDGDLSRLPDAAIAASLSAAGLGGARESVTFDSPIAYGFPATSGYADDPVNTASGNFLIAEADLPVGAPAAGLTLRRTYNSRSGRVGGFGPGWSSWADARLHAREDGAEYAGPDGQQALFPRQGNGYGRVLGVPARVSVTPEGLTMHWFDGRTWRFDHTGRPVALDDGPGTAIRLAYADGRLSTLTHTGGRSVTLIWTGDRITAAEATDGRRIAYTYTGGVLVAAGDRRYEVDDDGRVAAVIDADGVVEAANTYDAAGRVMTQVSRFGRRTRFAYLPGRVTVTAGEEQDEPADTYVHDEHGRLLAVVDGHGQRLSRTYDEWGNPVTVTDRNGAVTTVAWDEWSRPTRRVEPGGAAFEYTYDDAGRVVLVAASTGATVRYRYEGAERTPADVVDAEGGVTRLQVRDGLVHRVTDPDGVTLSFRFDADGALLTATDADGNTARLERDATGRVVAAVTPLGRRTTLEYDAYGGLAARRDPDGAHWRYEHTAGGRPTAVIDPDGARYELRYGPHGDVEDTVDALGRTTGRRYDDRGNVTRLLEPDGTKWEFGYDRLSRLTAVTDPAGATWLREYDVVGNLIGTVDPVGNHYAATVDTAGRITGVSDGITSTAFAFDPLGRAVAQTRPDGTAARAGYDRCGRQTSVEDPAGGVTRIEYTPAGRVRRTVSPAGAVTTLEYDACGRLAARVDGAGRRRTYEYDADGALIAQVAPDGGRETFGYDPAGRLIRHAAPGAGVRTVAYDVVGRPVTVTDRMAGIRHFRYDRAGRLTAATDGLGNTSRYGYGDRDWVVSITDPEGGTTHRRYDEVGRLTAETDPLGRTTTVEYDPAGRVRTRTDGAGRRLRWTRDASGRVSGVGAADGRPAVTVQRDALGRPVAVEGSGGRVELRWDAAGRLVQRRRDEVGLAWTYDADGNRVAMTYPDGTQIRYEHDGGGLMTALEHPQVGRVALERDAAGRLISAAWGDARASWRYVDGNLVGYADGQGGETSLTRDDTGRVIAVAEGARVRRFGYDPAGQLRDADDRAFEYDRAGRLVREDGPDGEIRYTYDAAGQLVGMRSSAGISRYEYDAAGRRTGAVGPDGRIEYRWDEMGRPAGIDVMRTAGGPGRRTDVTVDAQGELAAVNGTTVLWDSADPVRPPCWLDDRPVAGADRPWTGPVDWQGTAVAAGRRDVWGAPAVDHLAVGYRGEVEFDGHIWLRDRIYAPRERSFLQPDALSPLPGTAWSGNPYHYAGNDPVNFADPLGLRPITDQELRAYRDELGRNAWDKTTDWVGDNWEYLAAGAMVVAGVGLMFTGVGGPAGLALMAASGGLLSAGVSAGVQKYSNGTVDWGKVGTDALIGAAAGGVGGAAGMLAGRATLLTANNPITRGMASGAVGSGVSGMVGRGLAGENPFDPAGVATDLLIGAGTGGVGGRLGAGRPGSPDQSRLIVQAAVDRANRMPFDELAASGALSPRQLNQLLSNPRTSPMFAGHAIHNLSEQILEDAHPGRFSYNASRGPDITDRVNGVQVEIATVAEEAWKMAKYPGVLVATYKWSPFLS